MRLVYLDHNATTPLHPRVRAAMAGAWEQFGNPSSAHGHGRRAAELCEMARREVADLVGAAGPDEICFTGSGSEANNLALQGVAPRRVVSTRIEHPAVLETLRWLGSQAVEVELVGVSREGVVDLDALAAALRRPADLVSVMLANNETGTLQPLSEVSRLARAAGALVHTDAIQAVGKIPVDVRGIDVDLLSMSFHKMNGPKGVGGLYVRGGIELRRLIHGGSQERGRRAGTENTSGIAGAGEAAAVARAALPAEVPRLQVLRDRLWDGLAKRIDGVRRFGHPLHCLPGTLALGFEGVHAEPLLLRLDMEGIAVSMGSACHSASEEPSHVLAALGVSGAQARGFLRLSLGHGNDEEDVDRVLDVLPRLVESLRALAPPR